MSWRRMLLWLILAAPAAGMIAGWSSGSALAMDLLHPSGEFSIRLMILAMMPGPLVEIFSPNRFLRGWITIRRNLGVAAFLYGLLHLLFYAVDVQTFRAMIDELPFPSIWTGWVALIAMAIPAAISFDRAMRMMGRNWKRWQYLVYPAFLIGLAHWVLLDWHWQPALIHLAPLALLWSIRAVRKRRRKSSRLGAVA